MSPLMHDVADVDVDALHVAAHFGMDIDHLVRLELPGKCKHVGNIAALSNGDARGWHGCCFRF